MTRLHMMFAAATVLAVVVLGKKKKSPAEALHFDPAAPATGGVIFAAPSHNEQLAAAAHRGITSTSAPAPSHNEQLAAFGTAPAHTTPPTSHPPGSPIYAPIHGHPELPPMITGYR